MSYSLIQGNLKPSMSIPVTAPGAQAEFATALAFNLRWQKPDGSIVTVPLVVDNTTPNTLMRVWVTGDSDLVGVHRGVVVVTCANGQTTDDPIDGTSMVWWVYSALGT